MVSLDEKELQFKLQARENEGSDTQSTRAWCLTLSS